jgi:radical SAM protein with 4Fe4S-binding SPASM domain
MYDLSGHTLFRLEFENNPQPWIYDITKQEFYFHDTDFKITRTYERSPVLYLQIVLGRQCNMNCKYCLPTKNGCERTSVLDELEPEELADEILRVANGLPIGTLLFFGGEPLLYFDKIKRFYQKFKDHQFKDNPYSGFNIATNGILLKHDDIVDYCLDNRINLGISWDGQETINLRQYDIMQDQHTQDNILRLFKESPKAKINTGFLPVVFQQTLKQYAEYALDLLHLDKITIWEFSYPIIVNDSMISMMLSSEDMHNKSIDNLYILRDDPTITYGLQSKYSLLNGYQNPFITSNHFCHFIAPSSLTVDMAGNVLFCKNAYLDQTDEITHDPYKLTNIKDIPTGQPFPYAGQILMKPEQSNRFLRCKTCVMSLFCKAGCPLAPLKYLDYNCQLKFYESLIMFGICIHRYFGMELKNIVRIQ